MSYNEKFIEHYKDRYKEEYRKRNMLQQKLKEFEDITENDSFKYQEKRFYERELELSNAILDNFANEVMIRLCGLEDK